MSERFRSETYSHSNRCPILELSVRIITNRPEEKLLTVFGGGRLSRNQPDWGTTMLRWTRKLKFPDRTTTSAPKGQFQRLKAVSCWYQVNTEGSAHFEVARGAAASKIWRDEDDVMEEGEVDPGASAPDAVSSPDLFLPGESEEALEISAVGVLTGDHGA
jgi:hypothetical protein